jgi:hypothetical protein
MVIRKNDVKENFSCILRESLRARFGRVPSAAVLAREFNLRAYDTTPISGESARRWLRGVCLPEEERLRVLVNWLGLDFNQALTHRNGNGFSPSIHNGLSHSAPQHEVGTPRRPGNGLSHEDQDLYRLITALPASDRALILTLLKSSTQRRSLNQQ